MKEALMSMAEKLYGDQPLYKKVFLTIGILWSIRFCYKFLKQLNYFFGKSGANLLKRYGEGSWVLITGSTDGIGKEYAHQFAKLKFNIILVSRTQSKLDKVAQEIVDNHKVEVKTMACDFSKCHQPGFFEKIYDEFKEVDISIIVNNVGIDSIERFDELSVEFIERTILINSWACALMMRHFAKKLAARKRSAFLNMSSMIGLFPAHHYNIYTASKAFVHYLSIATAKEYANVDILSVCPSEVSTPMTHQKPLDIWTISTKDCVDSILNDLRRGYRQTEGHWRHKGQLWASTVHLPLFDFVWEKFILHDMRKERGLPPPRMK